MRSHQCAAIFATAIAVALVSSSVEAGQATRVQGAIWAHGVIYDTVATDTSFNAPPAHATDVIYSFDLSGLRGQRSVSSVAPGDAGYNGGRWWVHLAVFTELGLGIHDPDGDGVVNFELTSEEQVLHHVDLGHIEIFTTEIFFECPLLKHVDN
ncbi:MAG: hypothetical protein HYV63_11900 [Candidatus Schekmanbacteria bacterium]|nr:hypothetical protein [Candidatus Schekmanbacteria bacterium]